MSRYFPLILKLLLLNSCIAQDNSKKHFVSIINKTTIAIDSVLLYPKLKMLQPLGPRKIWTIQIDLEDVKTSGEGAFPIFIFQNNKKYSAQWGFHDWGYMAKQHDSVYLFANGVNYKEENLIKPVDFILFIGYKTSEKIDSIRVAPGTIRKQFDRSLNTELILDFDKFKIDPQIKIYQQGKMFNVRIDHDWTDWNNAQEIIKIYDNGVVSK